METLTASIRRVTYCNEGYAILQVLAAGTKGDPLTVKGPCAEPRVDMTIACDGTWKVHPKYGKFFAATMIRQEMPTALDAIEKYLGSAKIPGIGKKTAQKLVTAFGDRVFDVLDSQGERLAEVPRLPAKTRTKILEGWQGFRVTYKVMLFLTSIGIAAGTANKVVAAFGGNTPDDHDVIERIRKNPYILSEISGIGFQTADRAALKLGFAKDCSARLSAGLVYGLEELALKGHTMSTIEMLLETTAKLLGVDAAKLDEELNLHLLAEDGPLIGTSRAGIPCVALKPLHFAEVGTARELRTFFNQPGLLKVTDPLLTGELPTGGLTLAPTQLQAVRTALTSRLSVLTGGPGSGKTTIAKTIVRIAESGDFSVSLCAPTGRAAKRLSEATEHEASTIHRLLGYGKSADVQMNAENPIECDLLIVDEASMLDAHLMYKLLQAVAKGTSVLLVGDTDQLPSVGAGNVLGDIIDSERFPVTRLSQIFRQGAGSGIVTGAHAIIHGHWPSFDEDFRFIPTTADKDDEDADEHVSPADGSETADEKSARWILDAVGILMRRGIELDDIQILSPMKKGVVGTAALNAALQMRVNPAKPGVPEFTYGSVTFRLFDRVMQTKNNYDLGTAGVMNGDIGRIIAMRLEEDEIDVDFEGTIVRYARGNFDQVVHARAISIHKSQGGEFPYVLVPLAMQHYVMLTRNLIYTALTRAKKQAIFIGSKKALRIAISTKQQMERLTGLHELICAPDHVEGNEPLLSRAAADAASARNMPELIFQLKAEINS